MLHYAALCFLDCIVFPYGLGWSWHYEALCCIMPEYYFARVPLASPRVAVLKMHSASAEIPDLQTRGVTAVRAIFILRIFLLRILGANFPGDSLETEAFHPLKIRIWLSQTSWKEILSTKIGRTLHCTLHTAHHPQRFGHYTLHITHHTLHRER